MKKNATPDANEPAEELEPLQAEQDVAPAPAVAPGRPYRAKCSNCGWSGEWYQTVDSVVGQLCPTCYIPVVEDRYTPTPE